MPSAKKTSENVAKPRRATTKTSAKRESYIEENGFAAQLRKIVSGEEKQKKTKVTKRKSPKRSRVRNIPDVDYIGARTIIDELSSLMRESQPDGPPSTKLTSARSEPAVSIVRGI